MNLKMKEMEIWHHRFGYFARKVVGGTYITCIFQVKEFFSELDINEGKQKRRLLDQGFRVPRRKSILPHHLHSVMGSANLRLARGDTSGAIELCKEVIRQGRA